MVKRNHFCSCVHTLQRFASMSGLMINIDKTVAVWIESRRNSQVKFIPELGFNWNPVTFKVLGVMFSTDLHETVPITCENKLIHCHRLPHTPSTGLRHLSFKEEGAGKRCSECAPSIVKKVRTGSKSSQGT